MRMPETDQPASVGSIAVCMVCRNEADRLPAALASVAWADEILLLDLQSDDGSGDLARAAGARVHVRPPHPIVEPLRDEVAGHSRCEWVLVLDPDERVRPGLAEALQAAARRDDVDAVVIPRMNIDFGWPPSTPLHRYEPQLRMYRRSAVQWPRFPNALPKVPAERVLRLPTDDEHVLEHDRNRCVEETADRLMRYAPAQGRAMLERGQEFSAAEMTRVLRVQFERHVLEARAWEDGVPGLVRAGVLINHHFFVWVSFWQLSGADRTEADDRFVRRLGVGLRAVGTMLNAGRGLQRARQRTRQLRTPR
jgi:(heptosyl)LPS beta-1,4-glucosyltransferase